MAESRTVMICYTYADNQDDSPDFITYVTMTEEQEQETWDLLKALENADEPYITNVYVGVPSQPISYEASLKEIADPSHTIAAAREALAEELAELSEADTLNKLLTSEYGPANPSIWTQAKTAAELLASAPRIKPE